MAKWIFNNISLKIGSIIIAVLLWFHVASERLVFKTEEAPIKFRNLPENLVIVNNVDRDVSFQIKTKVKQLILLNLFGHPYINIDLSEAVPGTNKIELMEDWIVLPSWRPLEIIRIVNPKELLLETENVVMKMVAVKTVIKGDPQEGNYIKKITIEPDSIMLIGGKGKIKKVKEIETDTIYISKYKDDFKVDKMLSMPDGGFSSETKQVIVSIVFEKYITKILTGVKVILKGNDNYEIYPETIDVSVAGPKNLIRSLSSSDIKVYVDVKDAEKGIIPYFNLPEGIVFKSCKPQRVEVRLRE